MNNELLTPVFEKLEGINPMLSDSLEVAVEYVPYVGKFYSHIKFNRLARRVQEHEQQLNRIGNLYSSERLSAEYINERVFPIVLERLIEDHEDSKINYILNGFENVFIEEKSQESIVINYFDTLRDLRYLDIKRLFYLAGIINEFSFEGNEEKAVTFNTDMKLQNMGLIGIEKVGISFGGGWENDKEVSKDNVLLYSYGKGFLEFITT